MNVFLFCLRANPIVVMQLECEVSVLAMIASVRGFMMNLTSYCQQTIEVSFIFFNQLTLNVEYTPAFTRSLQLSTLHTTSREGLEKITNPRNLQNFHVGWKSNQFFLAFPYITGALWKDRSLIEYTTLTSANTSLLVWMA